MAFLSESCNVLDLEGKEVDLFSIWSGRRVVFKGLPVTALTRLAIAGGSFYATFDILDADCAQCRPKVRPSFCANESEF